MANQDPQAPYIEEPVETTPAYDTRGIDMEKLKAEYETARLYVEQFSRDFVKLDNLVDGVAYNHEDNAPFVGDTTLAGLVRSIPRSSLKQLPVLKTSVNGSRNTIIAVVCNFLLKKFVFNEDTFGKGLLSTLQIGAEQGLTHGYAPFMVATGQMYEDFGTTLRLLHYSDAGLEPGVSDSNESGYHFVAAHLTPSRLNKILKAAKANPKTSWNVEQLEKVLEASPVAKEYGRFLSDPRKNRGGQDQGKTYTIVTRYETGPNAQHVTFCPDAGDAPLRIIDSKSKWGYPRVNYLVIDPTPLTPFGVSRVRLASPNQNLMNLYYQNIAAMLLLNSNPPVFTRGTFLGPTPLKRGAQWKSLDPNAEVTLKNMDNGALGTFTSFANQFASQIQNIMGGQTMTVNAGSKAAAFGKTAPGVQAGQALMSVETNQVTKILENFLRQYALVALDTIISEQEGEAFLIVDDETKNIINQIAPDSIGDDNKFKINWDEFYRSIETWSVEVDVSLSPDELKDEKRADIQDMLVVLAQNAQNIPGAAEQVQQLTQMLMQDKAPLVSAIPQQPVIPQLPGQVDPSQQDLPPQL